MKKRIFTALLALVLCVSAAFMFAGCEGDPNSKSTLTVSSTEVLTFTKYNTQDPENVTKSREKQFEEMEAIRAKGFENLTFTYTANGAKHGADVPYDNWTGKYADEKKDAEGSQEKVITFSISGLYFSSATSEGETRTCRVTINNTSITLQYKVTAPAQQQSQQTT
ncbi:MAG: hypothetical protein MJ152_01680 [Clostridia bacterium]|nr:hypothetical protein [Clostridia bacterium]